MKLGERSEGRDFRGRYILLGLALLIGLFVLIVNLYRLMVVRYDEYLTLSEDNRFRDIRNRASRGFIRDRNGVLLAGVRPSFDAFLTPAFCEKCKTEVIPNLAQRFHWDEAQRQRVEQQFELAHGTQRYQPMQVQVDLSTEQRDYVEAHPLPSVKVEAVPHRMYQAKDSLAHVIGYMSEPTADERQKLNTDLAAEFDRPAYALGEFAGRIGLEKTFEAELRGKDGWAKEVVDARGNPWCPNRDNSRPGRSCQPIRYEESSPQSGNNLILSIDARLQKAAEEAFPATAGAVVAMEVKTGFILAMLSRPGFDPNLLNGRVSTQELDSLSKDPLEPMLFRAAKQHYHPGSTFKPVTLMAALRSGQFNAHSTVNCNGGYRLGNRVWRCHLDRGHGLVDPRKAIQQSCDTFFYHVADVLGIDPIAQVGREFGLGSKTGLEIGSETPGVMPDSEYHNRVTPGGYTKGMALNTAIGQGDVNVTPLQLAVLYGAIANGGSIFQPQLVKKIESSDGRLVKEFRPVLVRQAAMTTEQHDLLVDALTSVVNEAGGTGYRSRLQNNILMAGKTGTAQVAKLGKVRLKKEQMDFFERDHAWFAGFAPAKDAEIVVVVLNEHGGHGGAEAAPTAAALMNKYFELKAQDNVDFQSPSTMDGGMLHQEPRR